MTPQPGDFAVIPIPGAAGKLISIGEWLNGDGFGDYDHAEIYVGNNQTIGAYPGGAALLGLPEIQSGWLWSTGHITLTDAERAGIVSQAMACRGVPYSSLDYFALAAHRLHIPAPLLKNYVASTKHMICSQLVDYCFMQAGVHLFTDGRWPGYVTPANLAAVINGNGTGIVRV
jgi:cell wall-associated NlpC family hydrolase